MRDQARPRLVAAKGLYAGGMGGFAPGASVAPEGIPIALVQVF